MAGDPQSSPPTDALRVMAAILGGTGVATGAFGAHALKATLARKAGSAENWRTAVTYQMIHAAALLSISSLSAVATTREGGWKDRTPPQQPLATAAAFGGGKLIFVGTAMFSGSIYCLCLDVGPKMLMGPATPLGGLLMIGGWVMVGMGRY